MKRKQKHKHKPAHQHQTILLSECPQKEHEKCRINFPNGRFMELCMCPCHSHAKPSTTKEPEPIVGIRALKGIQGLQS